MAVGPVWLAMVAGPVLLGYSMALGSAVSVVHELPEGMVLLRLLARSLRARVAVDEAAPGPLWLLSVW
jgi:hypothetical protein